MTIDLDVSPTFGVLVDVFLQFSFWCFKNNAWNINLHVWETCENNFKKKIPRNCENILCMWYINLYVWKKIGKKIYVWEICEKFVRSFLWKILLKKFNKFFQGWFDFRMDHLKVPTNFKFKHFL